VQIGLKRAKIE